MKVKRPSRRQVLRHLDYTPRTGELTWRLPTSVRVSAGDPAGSLSPYGYVVVGLLSHKLFRSHIVWFLETGRWPRLKIDHKNTCRTDDRIDNLRDVPQKWNNQNIRRPQKNNKAGLLGAYWDPVRQSWFSSIKVAGKTLALGRHLTALKAHQAYLKAKRKHHEGNTL